MICYGSQPCGMDSWNNKQQLLFVVVVVGVGVGGNGVIGVAEQYQFVCPSARPSVGLLLLLPLRSFMNKPKDSNFMSTQPKKIYVRFVYISQQNVKISLATKKDNRNLAMLSSKKSDYGDDGMPSSSMEQLKI